ncbi:hypothetical protein C8F01DRAFT_1049740 [Mycena amicta]|nr:hypothetical protein C8F01DRAFT_1049740 [Mycena amicta]
MDSWPSFSLKGQEKIFYPVVGHGTLTAATLVQNNGRLEWSNLITSKSQPTLRVGPSTLVYPATRPQATNGPKISIRQQAEQGANFLRMELPDVDVTAELIRDELIGSAELQHRWEEFDPFLGNQLDCVHGQNLAVLAFPVGELGRDLNLSPLARQNGKWKFKPFAQAVQTYDTPILQISSVRMANPVLQPFLSVRTYGGTSLLEIGVDQGRLSTRESDMINSSSTGGKAAIDVKLSSQLHVHLVNSHGAIYKWDPGAGTSTSQLFTSDQPNEDFWRLGLTDNSPVLLLMSKSALTAVDSRTADTVQTIHTVSRNQVLTSMEAHLPDDTFRVCTTDQLLWIDRRNTKKPLLAFNHGRAFDRSLEVNTVLTENGPLTVLSSRKHGLLTVYSTQLSGNGVAHVEAPYCLTASASGYRKGHFFLNDSSSPTTYFRLSEEGSINAFELSLDAPEPVAYTWSEDVQRLHSESAHLREEFSFSEPPSNRIVVDMRPIYDRILRDSKEEKTEEEIAENFYDLIEKASSFWQDMNEPVDHTMTSYDILFRSGEEPNRSTRADFLSDSVLKTKRGYRALSQGRVSAQLLQQGATWTHDLSETLSTLDAGFGSDICSITDHLRQFDLRPEVQRSVESESRESTAREQLALDLELSRRIYSPRAFSTTNDIARNLESMSLEEKAAFGYLRPVSKTDDGDDVQIPPAVRRITRDWVVGQHPRDFVYRERIEGIEDESPAVERRATAEDLKIESQRPPTLVVASTQRPLASSQPVERPMMFGSQPVDMDFGLSGVSQEFMASTQILPGAYGGRPKKPAKKRVGGF